MENSCLSWRYEAACLILFQKSEDIASMLYFSPKNDVKMVKNSSFLSNLGRKIKGSLSFCERASIALTRRFQFAGFHPAVMKPARSPRLGPRLAYHAGGESIASDHQRRFYRGAAVCRGGFPRHEY